VGGHDRGLDWSEFVEAVGDRADLAIVAQGANGPRIATALAEARAVGEIVRAGALDEAVERAKALTPAGGVVLLSPGAPSFDQFHDYAERGRRFAELAGFDGQEISGIQGLGIG
jgi:UDP-N-acetylmuramoylalanine--D-glutamate ligase